MFPTPTEEELLDILTEFDIDSAIVAGGVCRDIDLGANMSKDIDIFTTELPPKWPDKWTFVGQSGAEWGEKDEYDNLDADFDVYNFVRDGVPIQVIHVKAQWGDPVTDIVGFVKNHFDLTSSLIWLNIEGKTFKSWIYTHYMKEQTTRLLRNDERTIERAKRVLAKFPEVFKEIV